MLGSTQDLACELIHAHHELPLLVTADEQTNGRGRMGRSWQSPPGNFYGSLAFRASVPPARYGEYSFLMALVLQDTLAEFSQNKITLKWPNDIILDGGKCAGILIESEGMENEFLVIGVGVNLIHAPHIGAYMPVALWSDGANDPQRREIFTQKFLQEFISWHEQYLSEGFAGVRATWLQSAHKLGREITIQVQGKEVVGIFNGIDEQGSLLLTHRGATSKVTAADVRI